MKNNKLEIIIQLIETGKKLTIHKLSQETGISYKNVYDIVKNFQKENIITLEKLGNAYHITINKKPTPIIYQAEYQRRKELLEKSDFQILYQKLESLKFPFITLLFGSHAQKTANKKSDIDLMIIAEENRHKEIDRVLSILPINIHSIFLTTEEFINMHRSTEFSVVQEAVKSNIILIGIEDYYRVQ